MPRLGKLNRPWSRDQVEIHRIDRGKDYQVLILPLTLFYLIFGPLPEEIGWRGYAFDRLQARWSVPVSSLILGVALALRHLPQFFLKGTYQQSLGFGSTAFWIFMLSTTTLSVLYTWIYNNTGRSTFFGRCRLAFTLFGRGSS